MIYENFLFVHVPVRALICIEFGINLGSRLASIWRDVSYFRGISFNIVPLLIFHTKRYQNNPIRGDPFDALFATFSEDCFLDALF